MDLITLNQVFVTYQGSNQPALKKLSFTIFQGRCVLIQSESGHGKTTLGYVLQGVFPSLIQGKIEGSIQYNPNVIKQPFRDIGMCFKDSNHHLSMIKECVYDELAFVCENHGLAQDEISFRVKTIARLCHLEHVLQKEPQSLTMNEKQRLSIGALLCFDVDVLIFDEPMIHFDAIYKKWFHHLLDDLKKQGKTIILLDHHVEHYETLVDDVIVLHEGGVVYSGPIKQGWTFMTLASTAYERLTKVHAHTGAPIRNLHQVLKRSKEKSMFKINNLLLQNDYSMLSIESMEASASSCIGVLGKSGSGKTRLLKCIAGKIKPQNGNIFIKDQLLNDFTVAQRSRWITSLFSSPYQFMTSSVEKEICYGLSSHSIKEDSLNEILKLCQLKHVRHLHPMDCSSSIQKRMLMAIACLRDAQLVLMDHLDAGLDHMSTSILINVVNFLKRQGKTIIMVSHDIDLIALCCEQVLVCDSKASFVGSMKHLCEHPFLLDDHGLQLPTVTQLSQALDLPLCTTPQEWNDLWIEK
ncbi:MAG: energy-coupling factor ABC transporter ATP-binding protein [Erysipelotrichaceae bacterium]|nr:energy-coupling factor ABC transporter ATP-binding protein [Erysipelotrichaceae bacterium]